MTIMNWFRTKADLIADLKVAQEVGKDLALQVADLSVDVEVQKQRANRAVSRANLNGKALNEALTERDIARIELAEMKGREQRRLANLRKWGRQGALAVHAKRAALKAVA